MSVRGENWVNRVWYGNSRWYLLFLPLSWIYQGVTSFRRMLYRLGILPSHGIGVPVIVIGNITVGGTGKTPLTIYLAQELRQCGFSPGIVSRGYRGNVGSSPVAATVDSDPAIVGDEAILIAKRSACPVVVHPDRVAAALVLKEQGVNVIIADDGLQHYRLARDVEIVVVDGARMWGNRKFLPAGPLREPVVRLSQVHHVLVQADGETAPVPGLRQETPVSAFSLQPLAAHRLDDTESRSLDAFRGQRVHGVAAIGNPDRFFNLLATLGMDVVQHAFPDHATLTDTNLNFDEPYDVVMTEKDAVKCKGLAKNNIWYIPVEAVINESHSIPLTEHVEKMISNHG